MTPPEITPARPNPEVMAFLLSRRSRPARTLTLPVPDRDQLLPILTAAARVPDHGKLEPWRFVVLERAALIRLAVLAAKRADQLGLEADRKAKSVAQFSDTYLAILVIKRAISTERIPEIEQILSTGAVCVSLLNAAHASGWGANWLTGWGVSDPVMAQEGLGLAPGEWVAAMIIIGTETILPPERPRPDIAALTTWVDA